MQGRVIDLCTYPIKGLSACRLPSVDLIQGNGFPQDRMFGFAKASSGFDPKTPKPLPKDCFLVLMQFEKLAGLETSFDTDSWQLSVKHDGQTRHFDMRVQAQIRAACDMLSDLLALEGDQIPSFAHAAPHRFTDVSVVSDELMHCVSLINADSVTAFGEAVGHAVDPDRFRGNILIEGWPALSELDLVGRKVQLGEVIFRVVQRTQRCAATEVDPRTAKRDLDVPYLLRKTYGHRDMGIYLETLSTGRLAQGDAATLL